MKISAITNQSNNLKQSFKGYMVEHSGPKDEDAAVATGRRVEKGLSIIHRNRIYYADPLEHVSDSLKESVDYIVFDDEPRFPDVNYEVSKAYFYPGAEELDKNVDSIKKYKDYFYRMEMADRKNVGMYENKVWQNIDTEDSKAKSAYYKARVADAQYNQKTATEFLEILNESDDLRSQNKRNYYYVAGTERDLAAWNDNLPRAQKELARRKETDKILKAKKSVISDQIETCKKFISLNKHVDKVNTAGKEYTFPGSANENYSPYFQNVDSDSSYWRGVTSAVDSYEKYRSQFIRDWYDDKDNSIGMESLIQRLSAQLKKYTEFEAENKVEIDFLQKFTEVAPKKIKELQLALIQYQANFEKSKADLIPYFDKLKNYMATHALKTVK